MFENDYSKLTSAVFDDNKNDKKEDPYKNLYRAYVIKNDDPDKRGRIQVRIPSFHGLSRNEAPYFNDEQLPWAEPGLCICASNNSGSLMVPEMGSTVWVGFEYGTNFLVYFGGIYFKEPRTSRAIRYPRDVYHGEVQEVATSDSIEEYRGSSDKILYKSPKGATISICEKDYQEQVKIKDAAGQEIIMYSALSNVKPGIPSDVTDKSYIQIKRTNDEYIEISKDTINFNAKHIKINGKELEV